MQATKEYAQKIFTILKEHYPKAKMILTWGNNFELLVAIILSAQCTDKKVNEVTEVLFPKYRKLHLDTKIYKNIFKNITSEIQEIINFAEIPLETLEQDIKPTGFYHNKAKNIKKAAKIVLQQHKGILPKSITELVSIPGVGRKTANVFLGNAYHIYEGVAVDTHVSKQSQLLGLTQEKTPEKIEQDLMKLFDKKDWFPLTYLLIDHGRNMRKRKELRVFCRKTSCLLCNKA